MKSLYLAVCFSLPLFLLAQPLEELLPFQNLGQIAQKSDLRAALNLVTDEYGESGENFEEVLRLQEELIEYELK